MIGTVRRRLGALALAACGVGLVIVSVNQAHTSPPRALPHQFAAGPTGSAAPDPVHVKPGTASASSVVSAGQLGSAADGSNPPPRVYIRALGVDAPVTPVGVIGGQLEIPARPATLGWWAAGAAPGAATGTAVLVGHVDSAATGPGALFHLDKITAGQQISVRASDGRTATYRVTALEVVAKTSGLAAALFATNGPPRLVVITCGGPFDRHTKNYADNIVAIARHT